MNFQDTTKYRDTVPGCHKTCEKLKRQNEYPLTPKTVLGLILPLVIFIAGLVIFKAIFAEVVKTEQLQTGFSFLMSLALTIAAVVLIKKINKPADRTK